MSYVRGILLVVFSMFVFSLVGPLVRWIELPSPALLFFTSLAGALVLSLFLLFTKRFSLVKAKKHWKLMGASLVVLFVLLLLYYQAYHYTTLANVILTHYTAPIFAALLAPLLLKERLEKITFIALAFSFLGLVLITFPNLNFKGTHLLGITLGVLSGFFYGLMIVITKLLVERFSLTAIIFYQMVSFTIVLGPALPFFEFTLTPQRIGLLIAYAVLIHIAASYIYMEGLKAIKGQHIGIIACIEPLFVSLWGILFFAEIPSLLTVAGGMLILFSGYLILRFVSREAATPASHHQ